MKSIYVLDNNCSKKNSLDETVKANRLKKLQIVSQLYDFALATKSQFYRQKFPLSSEAEIKVMVLESIERGTR